MGNEYAQTAQCFGQLAWMMLQGGLRFETITMGLAPHALRANKQEI